MVKDINVLWDVVFVICMIYESMRDMEVKDSKKLGRSEERRVGKECA